MGRGSPGKTRNLVGSPVLAWRRVAVVHDCIEAEEGDDRPCVEVCCRKRRLRTQGAVGSPSGGRNRDVLGAGSRDRSAGEEAVYASD